MNILVLNCGSSSVKYKLISMTNETLLAHGVIERIGTVNALLNHWCGDDIHIKKVCEILNHSKGIEKVIEMLLAPECGTLKKITDVKAVGHRVVHGGDKFSGSVLINNEVKAMIRDCIDLAPLHNPHNFRGINAIDEILPGVPQVASFDTAFHQTLPDFSYLYGLPYSEYLKHSIRRYGFHGTSHRYVSYRAAKLLKKSINKLKIITCHLGNGASITAVDKGKSVDTSMGFTPLEGLVMGTRCGDIDPAIVTYLASKMGMTIVEVDNLLNKHSGLLGLSGISNDMRELIKSVNEGSDRANLALSVYCYRIKKYIGAYVASLNGFDALVFTAGVGENSAYIREKICSDMDFFGIKIDKNKNNKMIDGKEGLISRFRSKVPIMVIPTNEELLIARDTKTIVDSLKIKDKK
ncbi:acetate/propionate family kinase [bacterium]